MIFINGLFAILTLVFFILMIIGLIKPSIIKMSSRGKAFLVFFIAMIVSSLLFSATQSEEDKARYEKKAQEQVEKSNTPSEGNLSIPLIKESLSNNEVVKSDSNEQTETKEASTETKSLTGPQYNAVRSAKNYLQISGFSRNGLIQQLSSSAGDGYDVADATIAVDSLNVDWNEQAVRSANNYLEISGFSCKGLIQQLSSKAGDKYTTDQATYGAKQAGACS